jgi:hypothetical protein
MAIEAKMSNAAKAGPHSNTTSTANLTVYEMYVTFEPFRASGP